MGFSRLVTITLCTKNSSSEYYCELHHQAGRKMSECHTLLKKYESIEGFYTANENIGYRDNSRDRYNNDRQGEKITHEIKTTGITNEIGITDITHVTRTRCVQKITGILVF